MKIKMLTAIAGVDWDAPAGAEIDVDDAQARRLIKAGLAEPVRKAKVERAVKATREKAVKR